MTTKTLDDLASTKTDELFDLPRPLRLSLKVEEPISPGVFTNLTKLKRLGVPLDDALLSLLAQAPVDPINLGATLMQIDPGNWRFSAIDFSIVRVLARTKKNEVAALLSVDLMGSSIIALVLNKARQLTVYKTLQVEPRDTMLQEIQAFAEDAVVAATREN